MVETHLPNFARFEGILTPEGETMKELTSLIRKLYKEGLLEESGKFINLELGLCILRDHEIDEVRLRGIIRSLHI